MAIHHIIYRTMLVWSACALAGCSLYVSGDDGETPPPENPAEPPVEYPDGGMSEFPDDPLPCGAVDFSCEWTSPFELPEGGEIRLERIQRGADDAFVAAQALFFVEQEPAARLFSGPDLPQAIPDENSWCFDFRDRCYFDNGPAPECQAIADTRTYLDLGATVTLASQANEIALSRQPAGTVDPSQQLQHGTVYVGDIATDVAANTFYAAAVGDLGLTLDIGDLATGEELDGEAGILMPPRFLLTEPAEADFFAGPMVMNPGENLVFTWKNLDAPAPGAPHPLTFAKLATEQGIVEAFCVAMNGDGITVPAEAVDIVSPAGEITVGKLYHAAWRQVEDGTRLDLIGIDSKVGRYIVSR